MAYTTKSQIAALLPSSFIDEACDDDNDGDAGKMAAVLAAVLEAVDNEVNGYLEGRYGDRMPFSPVPSLLATAGLYLAVESLYCRRPGNDVPEKIKNKCSETRAALRKIRDGEAHLRFPQVEREHVLTNGSPSILTPTPSVADKWEW